MKTLTEVEIQLVRESQQYMVQQAINHLVKARECCREAWKPAQNNSVFSLLADF